MRPHAFDFSSKVSVMGILNVTPDSFSDGGQFNSSDATARHCSEMLRAGVDFIDVGGESSRPFAEPVTLAEELVRVIPAVEIIRQQSSDIIISVDTTKAEVARQALTVGADIINDISALRFDPDMVKVAKQRSCPIIIMHMQGTPGDMQISPTYDDIIKESIDFFRERIAWLCESGIDRQKIIIDPGIGFGKTVEHNLTILNNLEKYQILHCPVLIGHSRKSFITHLLGSEVDRDHVTAIISALCVAKKAAIIRVHDVKMCRMAIQLAQAIRQEKPCH
jgi:dihydropteroate synthase